MLTLLLFHKLGHALMVMQWFIRLVSGTVNASQETVRALGDNLSGPVPFLGFRESISFLT